MEKPRIAPPRPLSPVSASRDAGLVVALAVSLVIVTANMGQREPVQDADTLEVAALLAAAPPASSVGTSAPARVSAEAALADYISTRWQVGKDIAQRVVRMAHRAADSHALDPLLVLAVVARESSFQHNGNAGNLEPNVAADEIDPSWAHGLMQVAGRFHPEKMPTDESGQMRVTTDEENISIGAQILSEYLQRERGNLTRAVQRYNGNLADAEKRFARYVLNVRDQLAKVIEPA